VSEQEGGAPVPDGVDMGDGEPGGDQPPAGVPGVPEAGAENGWSLVGLGGSAALSSLDPLNSDGYPTLAALAAIRTFGAQDAELPNWTALLTFCQRIWRYPDYVKVDEGGERPRWTFATGGWSGNEDIIEALQANGLFWILCWVSSERGGRHIFVPRP